MGKRRTNAKHRGRDNDSESDEEEVECEPVKNKKFFIN